MPDTILLIEDNPNDAELTVRALKKGNLGNSVVVVGDGAEALEFMFGTGAYLERRGLPKPRLVLLDLKLPKVDGIEVLRRFKENEETRRVPVVVLTSSAEERDIASTYELGVNSYIVKPVEFENFARAVVELGLYWFVLNTAPND
ncbi:response regulator [Pengzhenrongella sp.]|jgi:two-component system response regulator|uniref:response regulator n=1 Tax=Pengzhenrongella sp. TaxID=2888820 RepID=UPI002F95FF01